MTLLMISSGIILWMILSFGIVLDVVCKFGLPIITKMVNDRKTFIDQSLEVAKEANAQLARLKAEGDAILANANKEQGRIMKEALKEREKIIQEARQQAQLAAQKELDDVVCIGRRSKCTSHRSYRDILVVSTRETSV